MSVLFENDKASQILALCTKKKYCTLDNLAEKTGVSTRTVRNYIKQLNSDLEGIACLINEKGKGYHLIIENKREFNQAVSQITEMNETQDFLQKRIAFIIGRLMNTDEKNTLDELAFDMNIGRSTLVNDLKKAAVVLEIYNLKILGKQNSGMYLSGDEISLRFFILENVYDYLYSDYPIDNDIKEAITQIAKKHDFETDTIKMVMNSIVVMLDRLLNDHPLKVLDHKYDKLLQSSEYNIALEIKDAIEKALPLSIPIPEILFITLPIAGRRTPTRTNTMADITITPEVKRLLNLIVKQIAFEINIVLDSKDFSTDLEYHMTFMLNRLLFGIRIKNPLLDDVKEKYPLAYKMAQIAGRVIEKEFSLKVSDDELGYLAFYYGIYITEHDVKVRDLKEVAIVCGTGRGTAKLISIQLQRLLSQQTKLDLFSDTEATKELLSKYDLVFTTVPLPFTVGVPLIKINEIFDEGSVAKQIEKVIYLQKYKMEYTGNDHSLLSVLIDKEKFFALNSEKSYLENVQHMVSSLTKNGFLDEGFQERLMKREEKSTMVFDRLIALPHTTNYASNHIIVSLGVLAEPLQNGEKEIRLIFLLGLPEQTDYDAGLLVKIYDEIISIANDQKLVHKLANTKRYEELLLYLNEK